MCVCFPEHSHDVHRHRRGQTLANVFEQVVGGEELRAARDQVLLQLQQLSAAAEKHLDAQRLSQGV